MNTVVERWVYSDIILKEEPNPSRETKFSRANGDREILSFPVQLTTSRIGNSTRLILCVCYEYCSRTMGLFRYYIEGTAEPVSRDQILTRERGQGNTQFPCSADHEQDWQLYQVDPLCVCVFSSHSFWTSSSLDIPAGVTQEENHTGFLIHLLSTVRALVFLARRIQPFLSLVDREVEFCVLTIKSFSTRWAFLLYFFIFFSEKNPVCRDRTHVPTCQKVTWLPLSYRGDRPSLLLLYVMNIHTLSTLR